MLTASAISLVEGRVTRTYAIGTAPHGIDLSDNGATLFATSKAENKLVAVDLGSGAGFDLLIASETAKFVDAHGKWGMTPTWGMSQRLPRRVGSAMARELIYTGKIINAEEALRIGLANALFEPDELVPAATGVGIARHQPLVLGCVVGVPLAQLRRGGARAAQPMALVIADPSYDEPATASAHYLFRASSTTVPYHIRNWPSSRDITLQPYPWARTLYFKHIDVYEDGNQDPHRIRAHHVQGNYRLRCPTLLPWVASADRFHPHVWPSHRRLMTPDLARINIENLHVDGISG